MWKWKYWRYFFLAVAVAYYFCLPEPLFTDPYSTVLEDRHGALLSAVIAKDGQWRFPEADSVSSKFATALVAFEDKRFYHHPGVDILSFGRALVQNIQAGKVVSGGSTISMQVIRLMRKGKSRTWWEKMVEMVLATRLELRYSKEEIIRLYAAHAPFGGNVVGVEAACWRYFGREPSSLSWGEACMLAVLPNAPALIHPGRNRERLIQKRNTLLERLEANGVIDSLDCALAKTEPIPDEPKSLPRYARHLLHRAAREGHAQQKINVTVDKILQQRVEQIVADHHNRLKGNHIFNLAVLVLDVASGEVLAYVGNTSVTENESYGDEVDVITSPRSTGSILKPFLYAAMLDEGKILPSTLLPDVPTIISGFTPKNFSKEYDGAVPADQALIRSLNIPAVHLLRDYRYEKLHALLKNMGMSTLTFPADHYGLSLILGGAEGTLWDVAGMYASMARTLNHYTEHPGKNRYDRADYAAPSYLSVSARPEPILEEYSWLSAASIYQTFDVLKELYRPGEETGWRYFSSSRNISWKTGTSFGHRDAWSVGVTPDHVVGVWVGNADGEGRPGLTGTDAAAPVMFDVFAQLPGHRWFQPPLPELKRIAVCTKSGMRMGDYCEQADTMMVAARGLESRPCAFHKRIHLSPDEKYQVHSGCASLAEVKQVSWFILPPVQEYYYRWRYTSYKTVPPFKPGCQPTHAVTAMEMVYPKVNSKIFIPKELDGTLGSTVFELAHHNPDAHVYWHLDGAYLGVTRRLHRMVLQPAAGKHILTVVDDAGETLERSFEILSDKH